MSLVQLVQEAAFRIVLVLVFATPSTLIAWAICRYGRVSEHVKVSISRLAIVKALVIDVLGIGVFGFTSAGFSNMKLRFESLPDPVNATILNVYAIGFVGLMVILASSVFVGERIRVRAKMAPRSICDQIAGLWQLHNGHGKIEVRQSTEVHCASLAGLIRPTILVPLDARDVKVTEYLHEIGHILHKDLAWTLATKLFQFVLFPLPWAHWLATEISLWQEIRADGLATRQCASRRLELAESILLAAAQVRSPLLSMSGAGKNVARRLDFLYRPVYTRWASLGALGMLLVSMMPLPLLQYRIHMEAIGQEQKNRTMLASPLGKVVPSAGKGRSFTRLADAAGPIAGPI